MKISFMELKVTYKLVHSKRRKIYQPNGLKSSTFDKTWIQQVTNFDIRNVLIENVHTNLQQHE